MLIAAESKREEQEKKETQEKIAQIKAGDPKEMSVALLREVLMEIDASFKSNDKKAKLIEKVIQAKMLQNDTGDDNLLATVSPMDSVSAYIEEPCKVPEGPKFDWFGKRTHTKFGVRFGSIAELNGLSSIEFDFSTPGVHEMCLSI